jgi:two-component system LytT family response regulator
MSLSVLIADDEVLARARLRRLLSAEPGLLVVGECANGVEVVKSVKALRPQLLFLDIEMPDLDGLSALSAARAASLEVVFVTAHAQHAARAFDENAVDYVLKPYTAARLREAVARARQRIELGDGPGLLKALQALAPKEFLERLAVRSRGKIELVKVHDIDYLEADGNHVRVVCGKTTHVLRQPLSALQAKLDPRRFARIHRSTVVNIDRVRALEPWSAGDYAVLLHDGRTLTLSRTYHQQLALLLGDS